MEGGGQVSVPDQMTVGPDCPPPVGAMGGSVHSWERAADPWHRDAFPDEFMDSAPNQGVRQTGWVGLDAFGNSIGWVADGTPLLGGIKKEAPSVEPTSHTDQITCPKCGYEDKDSWEWNMDGEEGEYECPGCEAKLHVTRHVTVEYSAEVKEASK